METFTTEQVQAIIAELKLQSDRVTERNLDLVLSNQTLQKKVAELEKEIGELKAVKTE